jgi:acetylornithine/N-succinyldiaminopimelate aminotransferase
MEEPLDSFVPTERTRVRRLHASEGGTFHFATRLKLAHAPAGEPAPPGADFFDKMRRNALLLKQRLAEIRGEGYLVGLRAMVPNGQLVDALRAEKGLAGDNVVRRLLPPLIISEAEIVEAIVRLDRTTTALEHAAEKAQVAREATG